MKFFLTTLISLFSCYCNAQQTNWDREEIFKVLFAENTVNKSGRPLQSLDCIQRSEILKIGNQGSLVLIHRLGFPIEINRNASFRMDSLDSLVLRTLNQKQVRKRNIKTDELSYGKSKMDYLFIEDGVKANEAKLSINGVCVDCGRDIIYQPGKFFSFSIFYDNQLCIKWSSTPLNLFEVVMVNEFDELLYKLNIDSNHLELSGPKLDSIKGKSGLLILQIKDRSRGHHEKMSMEIVSYSLKKIIPSGLPFSYSCDISNASSALLIGLQIELNRYVDKSSLAREYYQLATQLSDKSFYKEMLSNFEKRLGSAK